MAPDTGVVHPISNAMMNMKFMEKATKLALDFTVFGIPGIENTHRRTIAVISAEAAAVIRLPASTGRGLKRVFQSANGAAAKKDEISPSSAGM